jgi:hypothetical protein
VDNSFDNMERPLLLFPEWFASAGLVYVSPQVVAALLIQATEGPDVSVSERMPHFIEEARDVAESLIERCGAESRSFCLLDLDAQKRTFEAALQGRDTRGVLTVSRNEASEPGTKVAAWLPIELRPMVARATQPRLRVASQW